MKFGKLIAWVGAAALILSAADNTAIVQAIKANPSLLDSAAAKNYMAKQPSPAAPATFAATQEQAINLVDSNETNISVADTNATDTNASQNDEFDSLTRSPLTIEEQDDYLKRLLTLQIRGSKPSAPLRRYGIEFFTNKNGLDLSSLPVPENYKLVPKDVLSVILYGPKSDNMSLTVDKDGSVVIPSFGPLNVAGLSFSDAKKVISDALMAAYPNVGVTVNVTQFSTIQVTLAGEVATPGIYNVSSFSTVKEALIAAGGLSQNGSMREVVIKRNNKVVSTVDLYRIIRGTANKYEALLKAGDVIVVPIIGKSVTVDGNVKRPAIYEAKKGESLGDLIYYAGGLSAEANKNDIRITRFEGHEKISALVATASNAKNTPVMDQDKVFVQGLDKSNLHGINIFGNIVKPGFWPLAKEGMSLQEFFKREISQNTLRGVFLEETHFDYAIIKRMTPNLKEELIGFSLAKALKGEENISLRSRDELFILNRSLVEEKPTVKIEGECITRPGEYRFFDKMTLQSLLGTAGTNCLIDRSNVTIITRDSETHRQKVKTIDMRYTPNVPLSVFDEVKVIGFYTVNPVHEAAINGEVYLPGKYPIGDGEFTLQKLINAAGGVTDKASSEKVEIVRYSVINGIRTRSVQVVSMSDALGENSPLVKNYDEVTVFKVAQWNERKSVKVYGKVKYPSEYPIEDGDTLSDVLKRAGGFSETAYVEGAVFTREELKTRQREGAERQIKDLEQRIMFVATQPTEAGQSAGDKSQLVGMLSTLKDEIKNTEFAGRLSIHLEKDMGRFEGSSSDVLLKHGDVLYVPEREDSVMVQGQVLNPNAVVYHSGLSLEDYLNKAGGLKESADEENIFVVHANGEAEGFKSSYLFNSSTYIGPGDVIVVPMHISTYSGMQFAKDITSILYQLAVSVAALNTIGAL